MPEGAEVKIIGGDLSLAVGTDKIMSIKPISGRYIKKPIEGLDILPIPSKVVGVGVKGKLIFWILDNDFYILNTLGMTGGWSLNQKKHSRVAFELSKKTVYFNDSRNFGTLKVIKGRTNFLGKLDSIGPDMLSEEVSDELFSFCIRGARGKTVCEAIMNQKNISGVGNYVKAEALYRAKINPHRIVEDLSDEEMTSLNAAIKDVLRRAYHDQGASIRDYRKVDGEAGEATLEFKVYGKKFTPDGLAVIRTETPDGRTTHWCPEVQI